MGTSLVMLPNAMLFNLFTVYFVKYTHRRQEVKVSKLSGHLPQPLYAPCRLVSGPPVPRGKAGSTPGRPPSPPRPMSQTESLNTPNIGVTSLLLQKCI